MSPYYDKAKTLGFFYGMGNIAAWPAARLGGALPEQPSTLPVEFDVSTVNGAVAARMTVTRPSGAQTTTQCANTPCSVPVDLRQGDHWVRTEYLDANGAALPQAATHLLKISPDLGSPAQPANNNR